MTELESADAFARRMVEAVEDDHLLSREALPVFIAAELEADRAAVARALLEEYAKLVASMWAGGYGECAELNNAYGGAHARLLAKYTPLSPEAAAAIMAKLVSATASARSGEIRPLDLDCPRCGCSHATGICPEYRRP